MRPPSPHHDCAFLAEGPSADVPLLETLRSETRCGGPDLENEGLMLYSIPTTYNSDPGAQGKSDAFAQSPPPLAGRDHTKLRPAEHRYCTVLAQGPPGVSMITRYASMHHRSFSEG